MEPRASSSAPRPICVLSVGRSGTSLATRALNLLGVHLGAEQDLLGPSTLNEMGFWEHGGIYRLNEDLLDALGGSWYRPPEPPSGWEREQRFGEFRERARTLVAEIASQSQGRWGFKDARFVVLLPFWRKIVGEMDYVICVRRADAVINSVEMSGLPGVDPVATARLWLAMNIMVLARTAGERRTFVFYEDWFDDLRGVAQMLSEFVHGEQAAIDAQAAASIEGFFRRDLGRADAQGRKSITAVPRPELDAVYEHLRSVATEAGTTNPETLARQLRIAEALASGYTLRNELEGTVHDARDRTAQLSKEAELLRRQAADLEHERGELCDEAASSQRENDELRDELARREQWLDGMRGSASWRLTAPLRAGKRRLNAGRGLRTGGRLGRGG